MPNDPKIIMNIFLYYAKWHLAIQLVMPNGIMPNGITPFEVAPPRFIVTKSLSVRNMILHGIFVISK